MSRVITLLWLMFLALFPAVARAVTYANASTTYAWIDASTHTKLGPTLGAPYSTAYRFSNPGGCGSNPPFIDDSISSNIPIGFTFMYGGVNFTDVRIQTNGRLQFNNNTTCGYGSPVTQLPYPNAGLNNTLRIYGGDLDPSLQSEIGGGYVTNCVSRNACYISYATVGIAPYRSFVVTWSNVPEWTSFVSATGSYNVQIILQENGEFIYQYGANTPGPGNTVGQVGWQVDSNDYEVPAIGYPANNTATKYYIARPVAEYRMEQGGWAGTAGEVLDTSGNARHGTAVFAGASARPAEVATGKVCSGGQFADNSIVADISAIDTGISIPATVGGVGTISFWYNNSSGNRMLFDASVTNNRWFYLTRTNSRALSFVVTDSGNNNRTVTTANNTVPNTGWTHIAVTWNFNSLAAANSDRLRIYVNGILTTTSAFSTANTVSASIGALYIGDNRSGVSPVGGSAGNGGGGTNATIDEFRIYNYEGGVALVQRDMNQASGCINHYAITTSGTPSVCPPAAPIQVTVKAHDGTTPTHGLVTMPNNTTQITLYATTTVTPNTVATSLTNGGDWSLVAGYGTFTDATANDGLATYIFNGEYQAVFSYQPTISGNVYAHVTDGQIVESENTVIPVPACGPSSLNAFEPPAAPTTCATLPVTTTSGSIKTKISGTTYPLCVVALNAAVTPQIDTAFNGDVKVEVVPTTNCLTATAHATTSPVTLTSGRASVTVDATANAWQDASIRISYPTTSPTVVACSNNNYAIRPNTLGVAVTDGDWETAGTTRTLNNTAAPGGTVHKAGRPFTITATAYNGAGTPAITSNYPGTALPSASIATHLIPTACLNAVACTLSGGTFADGTANDGIVASSTASYAEVGAFTILLTDSTFANVDASDSSAAERNITGTVLVGRFVPDHFTLTAGARTPACGAVAGLTYMGQPFTLTATLVAQNFAGTTTKNYHPDTGGYAPATVDWQAENANSGTNLNAPVRLTNAGSAWANGSYVVNSTTATFGRLAAGPDGPFDTLQLGLQLTDPDGPVLGGLDMKATTSDDCVVAATCDASAVGAPISMRYGRLRLLNAYGSELLPLRLPVRAEHFNGATWSLNTNDNCTALTAGALAIGNVVQAAASALAFNVPPAGVEGDPSSLILNGGTMTLKLTPSTRGAGSADIALNMGAGVANPTTCTTWTSGPIGGGSPSPTLAWLAGNTCAAGGSRTPAVRIKFGSPKSPTIYLRERY